MDAAFPKGEIGHLHVEVGFRFESGKPGCLPNSQRARGPRESLPEPPKDPDRLKSQVEAGDRILKQSEVVEVQRT
jgi:hypothetical protein